MLFCYKHGDISVTFSPVQQEKCNISTFFNMVVVQLYKKIFVTKKTGKYPQF